MQAKAKSQTMEERLAKVREKLADRKQLLGNQSDDPNFNKFKDAGNPTSWKNSRNI